MAYNNPWMYNDKVLETEDTVGYAGMVYLITNLDNGKSYIGKKFFWKPKHHVVKGKKKITVVESDWKKYYGSCKQLLEDIEQIGLDNIQRSVLRLCKTKTECAYFEMKEQIDRGALISERYYNEFIGGKITGKHLRKHL